MMATTHLLAGLLMALPLALMFPRLSGAILVGAAIGSILPDLDLYYGHRRTLHFPRLGMLLAPIAALPAIVWPHPVIVAVAVAIVAMVAHARMDIYGGGLELRPWEGDSDRAVFDHLDREWIAPRRFIRYDGAPEDVLFAIGLAIPLLVLLDGYLWWLTFAVVGVSVIYGLVRKPIVDVGVVLLRHAPPVLLSLLPLRYLEGELADRV